MGRSTCLPCCGPGVDTRRSTRVKGHCTLLGAVPTPFESHGERVGIGMPPSRCRGRQCGAASGGGAAAACRYFRPVSSPPPLPHSTHTHPHHLRLLYIDCAFMNCGPLRTRAIYLSYFATPAFSECRRSFSPALPHAPFLFLFRTLLLRALLHSITCTPSVKGGVTPAPLAMPVPVLPGDARQ